MANNGPKCRECGGALIKDEDGRKCINCGRTWKSKQEIAKFYDDHKNEILKDVAELGRPKAMAKWQIPSGSAGKVLARFGYKEPPAPRTPGPIRSSVALPNFPEFNESWPPDVQVAWLNTYEALNSK